jgi:hypothetical protein
MSSSAAKIPPKSVIQFSQRRCQEKASDGHKHHPGTTPNSTLLSMSNETTAKKMTANDSSPMNIATISAGFEKGDFLVREEQGNRVYFDFFEEVRTDARIDDDKCQWEWLINCLLDLSICRSHLYRCFHRRRML